MVLYSRLPQTTTPQPPKKVNLFAELDSWGTEESDDALEAYLLSPALPKVGDPIMYWQSQLTGGDPMARMSLDFLSAPASSVDVERAFSRGGLVVSKRRHALSDESVRASTVFGSWVSLPGIIPETQIIEVLRGKSKRSKKTSVANVYCDDSDVEIVE